MPSSKRILPTSIIKVTITKEDEEQKDGFVIVVIHTKDGKEKPYAFAGDLMTSGTKKYTITKTIRFIRYKKFLNNT